MVERKQLLPKWIRFFCWVFLPLVASPIILIAGLYVGDMEYSLFGINYYGPSLRPLPIFMILMMSFHGIAAYGLLWSKKWGIDIGISCGLIGVALSIVAMIGAYTKGRVHFELSVFAQILFIMTLFTIRKKWLALDED